MSLKLKSVVAKAAAAVTYISIHRKQLSAAVAVGAGLLEAINKVS